jgi:hypothetical protein
MTDQAPISAPDQITELPDELGIDGLAEAITRPVRRGETSQHQQNRR